MESYTDSDQENPGGIIPEPKDSTSRKRLLLSIALVVVLPFLCLVPYLRFLGYDTSQPEIKATSFWISRFLIWLLLGGFIFYAYKIEKAKLLLWKEEKYPFPIYIAFTFGTLFSVYLAVALVTIVLLKLGLMNDSAVDQISGAFTGRPLLIAFTCLTAGVTEELLYRGFLQPRLEMLFKSRVVAIIGSAVAFGLIHVGFGTLQNVIGPFVIGILFAIHYSYFRNIRFLIVFHILWDVLAICLALYWRSLTT